MKKLLACLTVLMMLLAISGGYADTVGSFRVDTFQGGAMGIQFIHICLEDDADTFCVWPTDTVYQVVLDEMVSDRDRVISRTIWTEDVLESNQVICLQAYTGEVLPRFRVTFMHEDGTRERLYIEESGEDGSLMLTEAGAVESAFPVCCNGLSETDTLDAVLTGYLQDEHSPDERAVAAHLLYDLWENERNRAWGGYAQSEAEQRWQSQRDMPLWDTYMSEDPDLLIRCYSDAAAETRSHVLALFGLDQMPEFK